MKAKFVSNSNNEVLTFYVSDVAGLPTLRVELEVYGVNAWIDGIDAQGVVTELTPAQSEALLYVIDDVYDLIYQSPEYKAAAAS